MRVQTILSVNSALMTEVLNILELYQMNLSMNQCHANTFNKKVHIEKKMTPYHILPILRDLITLKLIEKFETMDCQVAKL